MKKEEKMKSGIEARTSITGRHMVLAMETLHPSADAGWMGPELPTRVSGLAARDYSRCALERSPHQKRPPAYITIDISGSQRHHGGPDTQPNSGFTERSISGARRSCPDTRSSPDFRKFPNLTETLGASGVASRRRQCLQDQNHSTQLEQGASAFAAHRRSLRS